MEERVVGVGRHRFDPGRPDPRVVEASPMPGAARPVVAAVPWYEAPEFRALTELRRAFTKGGLPLGREHTTEAGARFAAFWTLYELGHVVDELARRSRDGSVGWCSVRIDERGPGHVVIEMAIVPRHDPQLTPGGGP